MGIRKELWKKEGARPDHKECGEVPKRDALWDRSRPAKAWNSEDVFVIVVIP